MGLRSFRAALFSLVIGTCCLVGCARAHPTGKVDVGDHCLFLHCVGQGSPTVVLDSGLNTDSSAWLSILPDLRRTTRVCVYDRAGLGASDHGPQPTTSQRIVQQLQTLLVEANVPQPYVLVGWSFGSWNVLLYASQHPEAVMGIVLLDAPHPDEDARFLALAPPASRDEPAYVHELRSSWSTGEKAAGVNLEGVRWRESAAQIRAIRSLGDIPLIVITAGHTDWLPPWSSAIRSKFDQARFELQQEFVHLSSRGNQIVATESGHCVQCYQPRLVIDVISEAVALAQRR
jgi:pimeloyl-ACP methyl ester carboxylesterase